MELLYPRCAAIDVHKRTAVAAVAWVDEAGRHHRQVRTFATMTGDLERLRDWLAERGVTHVAMESTGVYWKPLFNVLEERFAVVLANAAHVKAVPGRKTDVRDSEWLLELMQHGLIRASFIPSAPIRELRELNRHRANLVEERARAANRVQKVLEDANIKLASVVSDVLGVSGRLMLQALIAGETEPGALAALAKGRLSPKRAALVEALTGRVRAYHRLLLRELLGHLDYLDGAIARLSTEVAERLRPFAADLALLCSIAGIKGRVAEVLLAEIGAAMGAWPDARHLCSWAALCPGNNQSGGKQRSGRTRHGNRWLKGVLLQAALAATRVKDGYLGAQFRRIAKRRGAQRAAIAVAHSLLTIVYHVLKSGTPYREAGASYFDRFDTDRQARYHLRRLADLGYEAPALPQPAA
jgi:transposase